MTFYYVLLLKKHKRMRVLSLSVASLLIFSTSIITAQTIITKDDLKFVTGKKWSNKVVASARIEADILPGTNKVWDFASLIGGTTEETKVVSADGTDVLVTSSLKGDLDYKVLDTTYTYASLSGVSADDPYAVSLGLPHYIGKQWSATATGGFGLGTISMAGEVMAAGTIITALGSHNCILVEEKITGDVTQTRYYYETKEYGRIATYYLDSDELVVTESFGVDTSSSTAHGSGWEVVKADLYWGLGKKVVGKIIGIQESSLPVEPGDNKTWDFTGYANGPLAISGPLDTAMVFEDDGTTVKVSSSTKVDQWFLHGDTTFTMAKIEGNLLDDQTKTTIGLPHRYGKKWSINNTVYNGLVQFKIQGEVTARGTVKTGLGTFPCLLVKEITSGGAAAVNYYWETKEHGRVAAFFSSYDELIIQQARFSTPQNVGPTDVTFESTQLDWEDGTVTTNKIYTMDSLSADLNLTKGEGLTWDFSSLSGGVFDTTKVSSSARIHVDLENGSGEKTEYYSDGETYYYESFNGYEVDTPNTVTLGLPYVIGKEWFCAGTATKNSMEYDFSLKGEVIAQGKITTPLGTYDVVLVEESFGGEINADNYYWYTEDGGRVASYDDDSNELTVAQNKGSNSVKEIGFSEVVVLFPNPVQGGKITIQTQEVPSKVTVQDVNGTTVASFVNTNSFNVSGLSAGIYVVQITFSNGIVMEKLVVR